MDGLRAGLAEAGWRGEHLELIAALHVLLNRPQALPEWLNDQDPFLTAVLP